MEDGNIITYVVAGIVTGLITWTQVDKGKKKKRGEDDDDKAPDPAGESRLAEMVAELTAQQMAHYQQQLASYADQVERLGKRIDEMQRALTAREQELIQERERLRDSLTLNAQFLEDPGHEPVIPESIKSDLTS